MNELPYEHLGVEIEAKALCALGAIACIWGQIGGVMEIMIIRMSQVRLCTDIADIRIGQIMTSQLSFHPRTRVLSSLIKHNNLSKSELAKRINEFTESVRALRRERNNFIHANHWYSKKGTSPQMAYAVSGRLGGELGYIQEHLSFDIDAAEVLIGKLAKCRDNGWAIFRDICEALKFEPDA